MYQPEEFRDDGAGRAYAHVARYPFGIVVAGQAGHLRATHLPFLLDHEECPSGLVGHFARRNEGLAGLADGTEVMAVFPGPHAYVSPSLYCTEGSAPTWNYTAVHVTGIFRRVDQQELVRILVRSVQRFEQEASDPWEIGLLPESARRSLMRGIIGFRIDTTQIEGGYKLSQNKLAEDVVAVESALSRSLRAGDREVAELMRATGLEGRTGPSSTDPNVWLGPLE